MYKHFFLFLFLFSLGCTNPAPNPNPAPKLMETGSWESIKATDDSKPIARHEAAFVGLGDKFYLLGGRGIRPVSIFDTKTQKWTEGAPPPIELHHFQPFVFQNKIYIAGAFTGGWPRETPVANIMIYDPTKNLWETGPEVPADRRRGATGTVLYKNKVYLSCGIKNGHIGDHKKWLDCFDLETETWTKLPDAPRTRDHFAAVVANDKMYLPAGRNSVTGDNNFINTIEEVDVYDFKTQKWKTLQEPIPTKRAGNTAILYHDEILVIGGESDTQELAHNEVEALSVKSHNWRSLNPLLEGRHGTSAILFNDKIILASGCGKRGGEPELETMESFSYE